MEPGHVTPSPGHSIFLSGEKKLSPVSLVHPSPPPHPASLFPSGNKRLVKADKPLLEYRAARSGDAGRAVRWGWHEGWRAGLGGAGSSQRALVGSFRIVENRSWPCAGLEPEPRGETAGTGVNAGASGFSSRSARTEKWVEVSRGAIPAPPGGGGAY